MRQILSLCCLAIYESYFIKYITYFVLEKNVFFYCILIISIQIFLMYYKSKYDTSEKGVLCFALYFAFESVYLNT